MLIRDKYVFIVFGYDWLGNTVAIGKLWNVTDFNYSLNWLSGSWKYSKWVYVNVYIAGSKRYYGRFYRNGN